MIDSSVVIAYPRREPGWEALEGHLAGTCLISAVNLSEVIGTLRDKGIAAGALDIVLEPWIVDPYTGELCDVLEITLMLDCIDGRVRVQQYRVQAPGLDQQPGGGQQFPP